MNDMKQQINYVEVRIDNREVEVPISQTEGKPTAKVVQGQEIGEIRNYKLSEEEVYEIYRIKLEEKEPITIEQIKIGENMPEDIRKKLIKLINEHRDAFAMNITELGCTPLIEVTITDDDVLVRAKSYKTSEKKRQEIRGIVRTWKEAGIVKDTNSPYSSVVILFSKSNGENRLVIDYRRLNAQTKKTNFPIPHVDDCFKCLAGCKIFCTLDLMSGYLQVPLAKKNKAYVGLYYRR